MSKNTNKYSIDNYNEIEKTKNNEVGEIKNQYNESVHYILEYLKNPEVSDYKNNVKIRITGILDGMSKNEIRLFEYQKYLKLNTYKILDIIHRDRRDQAKSMINGLETEGVLA